MLSKMGFLPTFNIGFGVSLVSSFKRDPKPPAMMTMEFGLVFKSDETDFMERICPFSSKTGKS